MRAICFDMDGTIADLYGVTNWLEKLRAEDASPYAEAAPLCNMKQLNEVLALLQKAGYEIQVITCLSRDASPEYKKAIREAKKAWLDKYGFIYDHFHGIDYKTNKSSVLKHMTADDEAILIDDEARHLDKWRWGETINPTDVDLIEVLWNLLEAED